MPECIYASSEPPCQNAVKLVFMIRNFPWTDEELETIETIIHEKMFKCRIKDCTLNKNGHCTFKKGFSVINILNCPRGYGKLH